MDANQSGLQQAKREDFELDTPLPWPLYDEAGNLLLKQGFVITMPGYIDKLVQRGVFIGQPSAEVVSSNSNGNRSGTDSDAGDEDRKSYIAPRRVLQEPVFTRASDLPVAIRRVHRLLSEPLSGRVDVAERVQSMASTLLDLLREDHEAVIAAAYLSREVKDYRYSHQFLGAVIVGVLAPYVGLSEEDRLSLVCAAITRDIGLFDFDTNYGIFTKSLPEPAQRMITEHPRNSVQMLHQHGIKDRMWLRFVLEHHERPDGTGYPSARASGQILPGSLLLALADSYASIVLPNERRAGNFPANALRDLFLEKSKRYDEEHIKALLTHFSRFPPGTLVNLAGGEIGVVKSSPGGSGLPLVYSIYDRTGMPRSVPTPCDTSLQEFSITGCVQPEKCRSAALVIRRLWQQSQ